MSGIFPPEPIRLSLRDREIEVLPVTMARLERFAAAVAPLWPILVGADPLVQLALRAEAAQRLVATATGLEPAWLAELYPDEFLRLLDAVAEANQDFFARRVWPELQALAATLTRVLTAEPATGDPSSPGSSPAAPPMAN